MSPEPAPQTTESPEIRLRTVGTTTIVDLPPEVRGAVAQRLSGLLAFVLRSRPRMLLLNFAGVERIESSGIAACLFAQREAGTSGSRLGICAMSTSVRRLFVIARLESLFTFHESEEKALAAG